MQKHVSYKAEELVPVMLRLFAEGKKVIISATGNSMAPLIRNGSDSIVLAAYGGEKLSVGDIIFYKRSDGRYVLHRIIDKTSNGSFITLGDNQTKGEETVSPKDIIALPVSVIRDEKELSLNSKRYGFYTTLWGKKSVLRWIHIQYFKFRIKLSRFLKKLYNSSCRI